MLVGRDVPLRIEMNLLWRNRQQADALKKAQVFEEFFGAFLRWRNQQAGRSDLPPKQRGQVRFRRSPQSAEREASAIGLSYIGKFMRCHIGITEKCRIADS